MAYTGYTVKHITVSVGSRILGTIFVADADSADRIQRWFAGETTRTPDRRPKGPAPVDVKGAASGADGNEERKDLLAHFGLEVPESVTNLDQAEFEVEDFRYDTIDVWFQARQAIRLAKLVDRQSKTLSVDELKAEMGKLSADDRLAFLKKLAAQ